MEVEVRKGLVFFVACQGLVGAQPDFLPTCLLVMKKEGSFPLFTQHLQSVMNAKILPWFVVLLLFSSPFSFSQEEDFAEFEDDLREHFLDLGEEMAEELDFLLEEEVNLREILEEATAEGEEREIASLEVELARVLAEMRVWKAVLANHEEMMALEGEKFVEREASFNRSLDNAHRQRQIAASKAKVSHRELELGFLQDEEDPDEGEEAALNREIKQAKSELNARLALHEGWEKVEAARNDGREEEADQIERRLWMKGQDLAFQIESAEIRHRAAEARERTEELRKEIALAQQEMKMSMELLKHREELRKVWQQTKEALANANEEEREELLDEYHQVEEHHQLKREMLEIRMQLARAEASGDDEEVEELERVLEEIEEETRELEDEAREQE